MLKSIGLFVTLADSCNLDCKFCSFPNRSEFRTGAELDYDKFVSVLKQSRDLPIPLNSVCYCGSGEPLLYSKLADLVKETKKYVPQVSIVTNGVLLKEDIIRKLLECNINHIVVSVTGNTESVYSSFQGSGRKTKSAKEQFNTVRSNVEKLVNMRNEMKSYTEIGISYILDETSKKDYFSALSYWHDLGVNYVDTRILSKGFHLTEDDFKTNIIDNAKWWWESCCTCFGKVMNVYTDGRISFCNCAYQEGTILGNLYEEPLKDILVSDKFTKLCNSFTQDYNSIPDFCKTCDLCISRPILA